MKRKGTRKLFVALVSAATLFGCGSSTQSAQAPEPSETPKPTHVIWTVSPEEGVFDDADDVLILNGAVDWELMMYRGLKGYPSQWASEAYSPDVLKVKLGDEYTLYNYEGERLLDDAYRHIGNFFAPESLANTIDNQPFNRISVSDSPIIRWEELSFGESYPDYVEFKALSEDYLSFKEEYMDAPQYGDLGAKTLYVFNGGQNELHSESDDNFEIDIDEQRLNWANGFELSTPLDYIFAVRNANNETIAYRVIRSDGTIGEDIPYEPAGIMINGILPVFDMAPNKDGNGYGYEDKGDLYGRGIAAEGAAIGLYNVYTDEMISDFAYEEVGVTTEGYVPVNEGGRWGLYHIDSKTMVIPCILNDITSVYNGMVYVRIGNRKGVLNLAETLAAGVEINEETLAEVVVEETAEPKA